MTLAKQLKRLKACEEAIAWAELCSEAAIPPVTAP